jgi:hypothetical protein
MKINSTYCVFACDILSWIAGRFVERDYELNWQAAVSNVQSQASQSLAAI